jgi:HEAT repeat protein
MTALQYLSINIPDARIADGLCRFLEAPSDPFSTFTAVFMLQELRDRRLAPYALHLLDAKSDDPYVNSMLRPTAALAVAAVSESAIEDLAARLGYPDPLVRAAAVCGLRGTNDMRVIEPLRHALSDSDARVRVAATVSLRILGEDVPISAADEAEAHRLNLASIEAKRNDST